jgi:myosin heavy subunit
MSPGASIQTYLLEKVRLPNQAANERNFHIFYQLCAGASPEQRTALHLGDVADYHYTSQGQCFTLRQVDDRDELALTLKAMHTLGFDRPTQDAVFETVAGLLHLGQVGFQADASGEGSELGGDAYMATEFGHAAELLHLSKDYLQSTLTSRVVETRGESFTVKLKVQQATDARDALAKALYGRLFNSIVARINACIATDLKESRATVSVLDIFGFECFLNNSFEQLCINYCNEMVRTRAPRGFMSSLSGHGPLESYHR